MVTLSARQPWAGVWRTAYRSVARSHLIHVRAHADERDAHTMWRGYLAQSNSAALSLGQPEVCLARTQRGRGLGSRALLADGGGCLGGGGQGLGRVATLGCWAAPTHSAFAWAASATRLGQHPRPSAPGAGVLMPPRPLPLGGSSVLHPSSQSLSRLGRQRRWATCSLQSRSSPRRGRRGPSSLARDTAR